MADLERLKETTNANRPWLQPRSAYVHVPFCRHHCGYCDFAVVAGQDHLADAYLDALARELSQLESPRAVDTLYIGGGTPTHLSAKQLDRLLALMRQWFPLNATGEWSVESTPDSLDDERVQVLADHAVTRMSIGVQSFREPMLRALDRSHSPADVAPAIERVRRRIANISLDMIFGVPGQTVADWRADLAQALEHEPDHLSCYGLTFEKGTPLWKQWQAGDTAPLAEETEREMFLTADDLLAKFGFEHYEISNYARPARRCRHNETYWANHAYFGVGLGAAWYVDGSRGLNARNLPEYLSRLAAGRSPTIQQETLTPIERARETMTVQLRRLDGIDRAEFHRQTSLTVDEIAGDCIRRYCELGFLNDSGRRVCFTRDGLCVADSVLAELWSEKIPSHLTDSPDNNIDGKTARIVPCNGDDSEEMRPL